jgi:hypothetical protein
MGDTTSRLLQLQSKHAALDAKLEVEQARPRPDSLLISELKREKLRLKEQIDQLGPLVASS